MRVSIINFNLVAKDAVGSSIIEQSRFFTGRGDIVKIFMEQQPEGVPDDVAGHCLTVTLGDLQRDESGILAATDVYIYHYPSRYSLIETITQIDGGLVIFNYHNVTPPELWNREEERHMLRNGVEGVTLASYADVVVSPSRFNLDDLARRVSLPADRLIELPLPVDTAQFYPGQPSEKLQRLYRLNKAPVLLYVGRMASNKRIDLLVEVLAAVRHHPSRPQPQARLLLVGDNTSSPAYRDEARRAQQRARQLGVADAVSFTGRVDDLSDYYRLASAYVTTSQHEGFCVPLIEAMASGIPIVAAASTAIPGTLADAGILIPTDAAGVVDVQAMANAVTSILGDPVLAAGLSERGLARSAGFTVEKYRERLAAIVDHFAVNLPLRAQPLQDPELAAAETTQAVPAGEPAMPEAAQTGEPAMPEAAQTGEPVAPQAVPAAEPAHEEAYWPDLNREARIAMPEYTIRSHVPISGPLIAWARRNMTSHLKEPYLDLIIFRQQAFNLRSAWTINELTRRLIGQSRRVAELEAQVGELRAQVGELDAPVGELQAQGGELKAQVGELKAQVGELDAPVGELRAQVGELKAQGGELQAQVGELHAPVGELRAQVGELKAQGGELKAQVGELNAPVGTLKAQVSELKVQVGELRAAMALFAEQAASAEQHQRRLESQVARLESQMAAAAVAGTEQYATGAGQIGDMESGSQAQYGLNYLTCNESVGGTPADEMALYEQFLPVFEDQPGAVLDLGCGRGAFLTLLRERGLAGFGVDIDHGLVEYCGEQGLDVRHADVFDALRDQADASLGGIFCAHVVEHLPRTRLTELAALCWQKLRPEAGIVWITPHGGGLTALHTTFYKDLTHTRPLHPDALALILQSAGFRQVDILTLSDTPVGSKLRRLPESEDDEIMDTLNCNIDQLNQVIFGHVDCAAIGRR